MQAVQDVLRRQRGEEDEPSGRALTLPVFVLSLDHAPADLQFLSGGLVHTSELAVLALQVCFFGSYTCVLIISLLHLVWLDKRPWM
jgi:hypothetical protein